MSAADDRARAQYAERDAEDAALMLYLQGDDMKTIAAKQDITRAAAKKRVTAALARDSADRDELAHQARHVVAARLEMLLTNWMPKTKTDLAASKHVQSLLRDHRDILGLTTAAQQVDVHVQHTNADLDAQIAELVEQQREIGRQDALRELEPGDDEAPTTE
ncbi:hypothetical protein TPB0596_12280 [Tsukamurella pulmonis]|uniref:hypothetical protein n=1 Tax=Tsukamurella pulmonis TaxID=47312 RepID=UPI001EE10C76|nr:hypothetical protein [Tsukamurella pulmonis]BDD81465.1 hypothetical protein TPB0596_12280 [Tsukamurella pulmonis]